MRTLEDGKQTNDANIGTCIGKADGEGEHVNINLSRVFLFIPTNFGNHMSSRHTEMIKFSPHNKLT